MSRTRSRIIREINDSAGAAEGRGRVRGTYKSRVVRKAEVGYVREAATCVRCVVKWPCKADDCSVTHGIGQQDSSEKKNRRHSTSRVQKANEGEGNKRS